MLTSRISNSNPSYAEAITRYTPLYEKQDPVDLMDVFHSLDDDTVRRVFKRGALSESELRDIAMGKKPIQPPVSPSSPTPQPNLDPEPSEFRAEVD